MTGDGFGNEVSGWGLRLRRRVGSERVRPEGENQLDARARKRTMREVRVGSPCYKISLSITANSCFRFQLFLTMNFENKHFLAKLQLPNTILSPTFFSFLFF